MSVACIRCSPSLSSVCGCSSAKMNTTVQPPPNRWITSGREKCAAFEGNELLKPLRDHFYLYHAEYVNASWAWSSLLRGEAPIKELQQKLCCFEDRILTVPHNRRLVVMARRLIDSFKQRNFLIQRSKNRKLCSLCQFFDKHQQDHQYLIRKGPLKATSKIPSKQLPKMDF